MISIIVSTHKPKLLEKFTESLSQTIGTDYELITVENYAKYSICEAYNLGVEKSIYPYLCFVHEDVIFLTQNWGARLISTLENDSKIGLIGVAGSKFKSSYPLSGWGQGPSLSKFKRGHIYHQLGTSDKSYLNFDESSIPIEVEDVVCLDGVFLFSKREVFKNCKFDDKLLTHFHGYDLDISLQVFFQSYRVIVDRGVELIHFSGGNYSTEYTTANKKIWKKWLFKLPTSSKDLNMSFTDLLKYDAVNWFYSSRDTIKRKLHIK